MCLPQQRSGLEAERAPYHRSLRLRFDSDSISGRETDHSLSRLFLNQRMTPHSKQTGEQCALDVHSNEKDR